MPGNNPFTGLGHIYGCQVALSNIPDTVYASVCGTKYIAIYTCILRYYYHFYTG